MFLTMLTSPYTSNKEMPVYLDGYAYAGIFNIQEVERVWPATAGIVDDRLKIFEVLELTGKEKPKEVESSIMQE